MAQPEREVQVQVHVDVDLSDARRRLRRIKREVEELNRELARQEEQIAAHFGITTIREDSP